MAGDDRKEPNDRKCLDDVALEAARQAIREASRRHMLLGESIAVAGDGDEEVKILGPEEIRKVLDQRDE